VKTKLDNVIDKVLDEMNGQSSDSDEFAKMADQLVKLHQLKPKPKRVSADTLAVVIGNFVVTLIIVGYERTHIMTTRAGNFNLKPPGQY
jgi:hypothetical protein